MPLQDVGLMNQIPALRELDVKKGTGCFFVPKKQPVPFFYAFFMSPFIKLFLMLTKL